MLNYNDFLKASDEIELNKLMSQLDIAMLMNDMLFDDYTPEESGKRMMDLYLLVLKLQELQNLAMMHNSKLVYDKCEICIIDAEEQMDKLRRKYFNIED